MISQCRNQFVQCFRRRDGVVAAGLTSRGTHSRTDMLSVWRPAATARMPARYEPAPLWTRVAFKEVFARGRIQQLPSRSFSMFGRVANKVDDHSPPDRTVQDHNQPAANNKGTYSNQRAESGHKPSQPPKTESGDDNWSSTVSRRLHRPTKEELLKAATGVFDRLRIRFKWTLIRQVRPFNMDDMSAFFSWLIVGNVIWVILGTTTFFSLVILTANTVFAQETLARMIGNYLTKETGVTVVFESAIVPHWNDGVIAFRNVFVSRRPGRNNNRVTKGSPATAAAAAAAAAASSANGDTPASDEVVDDGNYTQFDLTVDSIDVTLSFRKWMNGKGILKDVEVKGIRGLVDRTHVRWVRNVDPRSYKRAHRPGDFEIDHFVLEDSLVTVLQPGEFRPFQISIFSCDLPQLRKQWLFYDFLCANHMSGSYDDSLFTIHPRQLPSNANTFGEDDGRRVTTTTTTAAAAPRNPWKKTSRIRIDGVNIDHLNRGIGEGPFSWITSGDVDIIADIMIPSDDGDAKFSRVMHEIVERWEHTMRSRQRKRDTAAVDEDGDESPQDKWLLKNLFHRIRNRNKVDLEDVAEAAARSGSGPGTMSRKDPEKYIVFDLRIQLNNVRAAVPLLAPELSYINNALVRPIVAYINNRNTYIPINCRVVKKLGEFDGSWTVFDSGLMDDLSAEVYEAIAANVKDEEERSRRMRKVGLWSLQLAFQIILMSIGTLTI
ncbi:mitochondrial distribution and morphology proteins-domain-containing protein [Lipomyces tetrasporus]|uniref:Mitochondrial distribution and morphology proteins-domain-containing protein n=1 Tax=Lipomyces tetrasporus TaxID=54092 RepID=A0AAD7VSK4_9ASCO|nr:mitochondrial distribution and morphology proteins-domain-containing protein [Lipomyces tetrasporus]KAJ8101122.1 mitochondrial distribution and morphology proteins-domain-containing protein [Lipomyces tetrasporus]